MYRIDDLITEIHAIETVEIPGELTKEQKSRIEAYMQAMIAKEKEEVHIRRKRKFTLRKKTMVWLAAALILALGLTTFAAKENEWDMKLVQFMGLSDGKSLQLEGGEVILNVKETSTWKDYAENPEGIKRAFSITGITSIGDKNSAYLKVNTDYVLPKGFDETTDYILPENHSLFITTENILGNQEIKTFASTFMACYEDGKLGFLISIENCEELNRCDMTLEIENLYWYHDLGQHEETDESVPKELLAEGTWKAEWKYNYESNVRTKRLLKKLDTEEGTVYLTQIEVSPISVRMEVIRHPKYHDESWTLELLEEIYFEDGSKIKLNKSSGGNLNGIFIEEFTNVYDWGEALHPENVKSIKVYGQTIDL